MKRVAVFPGSFDPFTKGHESIVHKASGLFDEIIIGIGENTSKNYLFDLKSRQNHIASIFANQLNVKIESFTGLTVDFCKNVNANFIIRGLRDSKDFGYERAIAQMNLEISGIESVFFMTMPQYASINSSIVREIFKSGGNIDLFVSNSNILIDM